MKKQKSLFKFKKIIISLLLTLVFLFFNFPFLSIKAKNLREFDLRTINAVTSVKNQGSANTCWAFSAIGAIESSLIIGGYADSNIDLSESHLSWFAMNSAINDENDLTYGDGCTFENPYIMGGNDLYVTWAISRGFGLELEEFASYNSEYINFTSVRENERYVSEYIVSEVNIFEKEEQDSIKKAIIENGALMASYYESNSLYNISENGYCFFDKTNTSSNHATLIVGWNDDFSRNNFGTNKPDSDGAWLCRNTRGASWGDDGYFWLSYETSSLKRIVSFKAEPTEDSVYHIYQYDGFGYSKSLSLNSTEDVYLSNIFDITENGLLSKIAFYSADPELSNEIKIYSLKDGYSSPVDGELLCSFTKDTPYVGYYLCDLPTSVKVNKGEILSVVIKINGEGKVHFFSEGIDDRTSISGKSFVSIDTASWLDTAENSFGNLCIKAWIDPDIYESPDLKNICDLMIPIHNEYSEDKILDSLLRKSDEILKKGNSERDTLNAYLRLLCLYEKYNEYFSIESEKQFLSFSKLVNSGNLFFDQVVKLEQDLDFSNSNYILPNNFGGIFNGGSHVIKGINLYDNDCGLFVNVLDSGVIKNVKIVDSTFEAKNYAGGISAYNYGLITNCSVNSNIYSNSICCGAISGINEGQIINCTSKSSSINENYGSISGNNDNGIILDCLSDNNQFVIHGNKPLQTYQITINDLFLFVNGINVSMNTLSDFAFLHGVDLNENSGVAKTGASYENIVLVVMGDINGTGTLNTSDYLMLKNKFLGTSHFSQAQLLASDIDLNGEISATDYMLIKSHFLNKVNIYGR